MKELRLGLEFAKIGVLTGVLKKIHPKASERYLVQSLSKMPGLPAKFAQTLYEKYDLRGDLAPDPLTLEEVKGLLMVHNPALAASIKTLDPEAKVASLGQVHRATLRDGREVAIKVQFPGLKESFDTQLGVLLGGMDRFGPGKDYGLNTDQFEKELSTYLERELDYKLEAKQQNEFHVAFSEPYWKIPRAEEFLTSQGVLVQEFQDSQRAKELTDLDSGIRKKLALHAFRFFLRGISKGLIHGDMHTRNFGFLSSGQVVIYDFGGILRLEPHLRSVLKEWVLGEKQGETLSTLIELGFDSQKLGHLSPKAGEALGQVLLAPVLEDQPFDLGKWNLHAQLDRVLGGDKWWFRMAGPPWFLILMRSLHGLVKVTQDLGVSLPLRDLVQEEWSRSVIERCPVSVEPARTMKVKIYAGHELKVQLEMPANAAERLEEVLSSEVLSKLRSRGIRLEEIQARARSSGFAPQSLFELREGDRSYFVTLT